MEANRSCTQGDTNPNATTTRTCSYKEFCSCMQRNFSGPEGAVRLTCWFEKLKSVFQVSKVADGNNVKYSACTMLYGTLTWWNMYVRTIGIDASNAIPLSEFNLMLIKKYCPQSEVQKMESKLWNLKLKGTNINIKGNVTSSKLADIHETITMAQSLMDQVVLDLGVKIVDNKRMWEGNHNNNNNYNQNKRQEVAMVYIVGPTDKGMYAGNLPHYNPLPGQQIRETKTTRGTHLPAMLVEKKGIIRMSVQKQGTNAEESRSEATRIMATRTRTRTKTRTRTRETKMEEIMDNNVITDTVYHVELADGKSVAIDTIFRGCTLNLQNHPFRIDLIPIELGSFDVIIEMDWLSEYHAVIACHEKQVRITYKNKKLMVQGV
ncbi:putative reverse transcriptase domain-containing protein [Tanacetum coccineum]|uniref:Reverse transcriptase domain-containing protein n=1 Tax=Tanacetum coccineum TaxID=301880 RepID=A0ABQ5EMM0_9ASTR